MKQIIMITITNAFVHCLAEMGPAISDYINRDTAIYFPFFTPGFFGGAFALLAPLYTSETTDKSIR
jgi:hypothetical protein